MEMEDGGYFAPMRQIEFANRLRVLKELLDMINAFLKQAQYLN